MVRAAVRGVQTPLCFPLRTGISITHTHTQGKTERYQASLNTHCIAIHTFLWVCQHVAL